MTKKLCFFVGILVLGFAMVACEKVKIGDINADPGRFMGKEVGVVGTVTQSIGAGKGHLPSRRWHRPFVGSGNESWRPH